MDALCPHLLGQRFTLVTDHASFICCVMRDPNQRGAVGRMAQGMSHYDFTVRPNTADLPCLLQKGDDTGRQGDARVTLAHQQSLD